MRIELDTLWHTDGRGRLTQARDRTQTKAPHLVIATAMDGNAVALGADVPDAIAAEIHDLAAAGCHPGDPAAPPSTLDRCARLLERAVGAVELTSGPSYLIPDGTTFDCSVCIRTSSDGHNEDLRPLNPPAASWEPGEWDDLLDGDLGPWAMATAGGRIVSICHAARLTARAAEAGVWTAPDHRGRGYAAGVTAAWSALFPVGERHLFYSTSSANTSSQQVAARLNLRPIGWTWRLSSSA